MTLRSPSGVDPHHRDGDPDLKGLRYGKICILSDADVDGSHLAFLLTLFLKHFPKLIELGHVCRHAAALSR